MYMKCLHGTRYQRVHGCVVTGKRPVLGSAQLRKKVMEQIRAGQEAAGVGAGRFRQGSSHTLCGFLESDVYS
jgi:hypothetical protein